MNFLPSTKPTEAQRTTDTTDFSPLIRGKAKDKRKGR